MTHPCLHYEINEAWFHAASDDKNDDSGRTATTTNAAATAAASVGAPVAAHAMTANGGNASWSYIVDPVAGYLLDGTFATTTIDDLGRGVLHHHHRTTRARAHTTHTHAAHALVNGFLIHD